jgi:DNA-directed RNA polymerase subunit RPC12/RpoP
MIKCPHCGSTGTFGIAATITATVNSQLDVVDTDNTDIEWDDTSVIRCMECDMPGNVGHWEVDDEVDQEDAPHVVMCDCGNKMTLTEEQEQADTLTCPVCGYCSDHCDFPDVAQEESDND